MYTFPYFYLWC